MAFEMLKAVVATRFDHQPAGAVFLLRLAVIEHLIAGLQQHQQILGTRQRLDLPGAQRVQMARLDHRDLASVVVGLGAEQVIAPQPGPHRRIDQHRAGTALSGQPGGVETAHGAAHQVYRVGQRREFGFELRHGDIRVGAQKGTAEGDFRVLGGQPGCGLLRLLGLRRTVEAVDIKQGSHGCPGLVRGAEL